MVPEVVREPAVVAVFGAGVMGEALIAGLTRGETPATPPGSILVADRVNDRAERVAAKYGAVAATIEDAASRADTAVLVVKPQDMAALLGAISPLLRKDSLVVSLAAGITCNFIADRLPQGHPVVRVMPNTPALVDEGMSAVSPGPSCDEEHGAEASRNRARVRRARTSSIVRAASWRMAKRTIASLYGSAGCKGWLWPGSEASKGASVP